MANPEIPRREFVKEVPELQRLSGEPEISRALERADAHALYAALSAWRKRHPDTHEAWVDRLLGNRRFFLKPLKRAPSLMTMNGVGTSLYGSSDANPQDGSYIATLFFVFLFVPIFPLAQYLVIKGAGRSWHFLGKVPMGGAHRSWRKVAALAGLVALLGAGAGTTNLLWRTSQVSEVQLLNGLNVPVRVVVSGQKVMLPAEGRSHVQLKPGPQHFRAELTSGELLEEVNGEVPRWTDLVVYNVMGSAPAYLEEVIYTSGPGDHDEQGSSTPLGGQPFFTRDHVPFIFQEAPNQIEMSSHSKSESRFVFDVAKGGWKSTLGMLEHAAEWKEAAAVAANVVRADPENLEARERALQLTHRHGGTSAVAQLAREWVRHEPENAWAQRLYVDALRGTGRAAEALSFANERLAALPDSLEFAELVARAEEPAAALTRYSELVKSHPAVGRFRRQYGERLLNARRFNEALAQFQALRGREEDQYARSLASYARTLYLLGKSKEALALLEGHAREGKSQWDDAVLYGQISARSARGTGRGVGYLIDQLLADEDEDNEKVLQATFAVEHGAPDAEKRVSALADGSTKESLSIRLAAAKDAAEALKRAQKASERALAQLDDPTALLLALEARRAGDEATASRLEHAVAELRLDPSAAWAYVQKGDQAGRLQEWSLEFQAVLQLQRARSLQASDPAAARQLYAQAEATRPLSAAVLGALTQWPRAARVASSASP
jgi:hypothetical protein